MYYMRCAILDYMDQDWTEEYTYINIFIEDVFTNFYDHPINKMVDAHFEFYKGI